MSEIEWKIEDGVYYVRGLGPDGPRWFEATTTQFPAILRSAIEKEREQILGIIAERKKRHAEDGNSRDYDLRVDASCREVECDEIVTAIRARGEG